MTAVYVLSITNDAQNTRLNSACQNHSRIATTLGYVIVHNSNLDSYG